MKRLSWELHRWAGLFAGGFFLVSAITGFALLFTEEANLMERPRVEKGGTLAPLGAALAEVASAQPGMALSTLRLSEDPELAWTALLRDPQTGARISADLNPYTGRVLGYRNQDETLFRRLLTLHYTFYAGTLGKVLSTLVALALVVLALTGLSLYRGGFSVRLQWRRPGSPSGTAWLAWFHGWTGLWSLLFSLLWGVTGFVLMCSILSSTFAPKEARFRPADPVALSAFPDTALLFTQAREAFREGSVTHVFPGDRTEGPRLRILLRDNWPWEKYAELRFTPEGRLERILHPEQASLVQKADQAIQSLHFGFLGRRHTLVLYGLGALAMISLPLSGLGLWWLRRRRGRRLPSAHAVL